MHRQYIYDPLGEPVWPLMRGEMVVSVKACEGRSALVASAGTEDESHTPVQVNQFDLRPVGEYAINHAKAWSVHTPEFGAVVLNEWQSDSRMRPAEYWTLVRGKNFARQVWVLCSPAHAAPQTLLQACINVWNEQSARMPEPLYAYGLSPEALAETWKGVA